MSTLVSDLLLCDNDFGVFGRLDTAKQLSAANTLLQAVESALPKQRRNAAASEYKHWAVAQSRNSKGHQQEVSGKPTHPSMVLKSASNLVLMERPACLS